MRTNLEEIRSLVESYAKKIEAPQQLLPTYGRTVDGAHPHIEIKENGEFFYVIVERGQELRRELAVDINDLLYKIFTDITFSMACAVAAKQRKGKEDFRRQMFLKHEELLGVLQEEWKFRMQKEHQLILMSYPFDDK